MFDYISTISHQLLQWLPAYTHSDTYRTYVHLQFNHMSLNLRRAINKSPSVNDVKLNVALEKVQKRAWNTEDEKIQTLQYKK